MKKREILLFWGTALFSLILLIFFGIRSIESEKIISQEQIFKSAGRIIEQARKVCKEQVDELEALLTKLSSDNQDIKRSIEKESLIYSLFLWKGEEEINNYLNYPSIIYETNYKKDINFAQKFKFAEENEFLKSNFKEALNLYHESYKITKFDQFKAIALNAMARCCIKLNNKAKALEYYRELTKFKNVYDINGLSLNLVAEWQVINLSENQINTFKIYEKLIKTQGNYPLEQIQYFNSKIREKLKNEIKELKLKEKFETLRDYDTKQTEKLFWLTQIKKILEPMIKEWRETELPQFLSGDVEKKSYLLMCKRIDNNVLVGQINLDELMRRINKKLKPLAQATGTKIDLQLSDKFEQENLVYLEKLIPTNIRLALYKPDLEKLQKPTRNRILLYYLLIAVVLMVIVTGIYTTYKAVQKELLMAKLKSDFASTVSHELRTPLTYIRLFAERLQMGRITDSEKKKHYYGVIVREAERLGRLVENVLDFSRLEEGRKKFNFQKEDFEIFIKEIVNSFKKFTDEKGFSMTLDINSPIPYLVIDREGVSQVLFNLLDNALKYSDTEKKIEVKCYTENNSVRTDITDYGIGIAEEEQKQIFDKFYRGGESLTRTTRGAGLGLTIAKAIVEAHRGQILVKSQKGKGSTFSVILPYA